MTIRPIFNNFGSETEQRLYEDLVGEFAQVFGKDIVYIPRDSNSPGGFDLLFGDDPTKIYTTNYNIEVYVSTVDRFEGGEFFSKFANVVKKQVKFLMPKRAFLREVGAALYRPREGDLIYNKNFKSIFEIKYVNEEYLFYDLNKNDFYAFELVCEKFRYNDETINTDDPEISSLVNQIIATYNFYMANTGNTGTFQLGEAVYQTDDNTPSGNPMCGGTVNTWNLSNGILQLKTIDGLFLEGQQIFGANSGASWTLNTYDMLNNVNNPLMDNDGINAAANNVLDWSEVNPFGDT